MHVVGLTTTMKNETTPFDEADSNDFETTTMTDSQSEETVSETEPSTRSECNPSASYTQTTEASTIPSDDGVVSTVASDTGRIPHGMPLPAVVQVKKKRVKRNISTMRRRRADLIRSIPSEISTDIDSVQVSASSSSDKSLPVWDPLGVWNKREDKVNEEQLLVAVEVTALTDSSNKGTSFCNFVGVVHQCSDAITERYNIHLGSRVASILPVEASARYVWIDASQVLVVPKNLDAADIVCIISTYLPAFLALHHGRRHRYSRILLQQSKVMIVCKAVTPEVLATIQLAKIAGSTNIVVVAPRDHHSSLQRSKVDILDNDPALWLEATYQQMQVVVDFSFPTHLSYLSDTLAKKGRLIANPRNNGTLSSFDYLLQRSRLSLIKRASLFDYREYVQQFDITQDARFLLELLSTRKIRPQIHQFVSMEQATISSEDNKPLKGTIICEPWRDNQ